MAIFRLETNDNNLATAKLVVAEKTNLELETYLESWLEATSWALAEEPILWIGRQTNASVTDTTIFPDLLGVDAEGNVIIVELKKGKAPREVIAQILEYAAWANELSDERIREMALSYLQTHNSQLSSFEAYFSEVFGIDEIPSLNQRLRLFIVAEEIPPAISRICRFLRTSHGVDISCIAISTFQTESGEILVITEAKVGEENVVASSSPQSRWSGEKPVKQVVWEAVEQFTNRNRDCIFAPKDIIAVVLKKYPSFNRSTVGCQIISDCVNHTSRHHYPGGDDKYWWVGKGQYRLFAPDRDIK